MEFQSSGMGQNWDPFTLKNGGHLGHNLGIKQLSLKVWQVVHENQHIPTLTYIKHKHKRT
jgi:hypothetical protein